MSAGLRRIVVVGASLAGLRAAEMLRHTGFDGQLTIVGDEPHLPYDRPPLSKQLLSGAWNQEQLALPRSADLDARWELGTAAAALDPGDQTVWLADGRALPYDGLVLATGVRARGWPGSSPTPGGVVTLRTIDDALGLGKALTGETRLLVVGGGFLGNEIASTARALGADVTLVDRHRLPLLAATGEPVGEFVADLHRGAGVDLRSGTGVAEFIAGPDGSLSGARLTDGQDVRAEAAVLAIGAEPNTDWLSGSGLVLDQGLVCDALLHPLLADGGGPVPNVVAAGDIVRWPHPLAEEALLGLGHWSNAIEQAEAAARNLLDPDQQAPFEPVPSFWSDLHGTNLRSIGLPHLGSPHVVEHDVLKARLVVTYHRSERLVGAVTVNRTSRLSGYRRQLAEHLHSPHPERSYA
ncbi:MAG TPA: FAD-dependent oxidoreductase [Kribbella sp.]|nr:FAD-dependent oxidoreductase [Kribbella sp.]